MDGGDGGLDSWMSLMSQNRTRWRLVKTANCKLHVLLPLKEVPKNDTRGKLLWISLYSEALSVSQGSWRVVSALLLTVSRLAMVVRLPFPRVSMLRLRPALSACWTPGETHCICPRGLSALFLGTELPGLDDAHTLSLTQQSQCRVQRALGIPGPLRTSHSPFLLIHQRSSSQLSHTCQSAGCQVGSCSFNFQSSDYWWSRGSFHILLGSGFPLPVNRPFVLSASLSIVFFLSDL